MRRDAEVTGDERRRGAGARPAARIVVAVGGLAAPSLCLAQAEGVLQLVFLGAAVLALVGLALTWFIGGWKLAGVYVACVAAWVGWQYHEAMERMSLQRQQAMLARAAVSSFCMAKAGESGGRSDIVPTTVYLRVDWRFATESGLRETVYLPAADDRFVLVDEPPSALPSGTAYVDVALLREPIAGAPGHWLSGVSTTIRTAGETLAKRVDVARNPGWCLGENPNDATERFIHDRLGVRLGFGANAGRKTLLVPAAYPIGTLGPAIPGRFAERTFDPGQNPRLTEMATLLTSMNCKVDGDAVFCAGGTPYANSFSLTDVLAFRAVARGWVLLSQSRADAFAFDSVDVVERSRDGAIEAKWRVRFADAGLDSVHYGQVSASTFVMTPTGFGADILLDRHADTAGGTPSTYTEWYARKARLESALPAPTSR